MTLEVYCRTQRVIEKKALSLAEPPQTLERHPCDHCTQRVPATIGNTDPPPFELASSLIRAAVDLGAGREKAIGPTS